MTKVIQNEKFIHRNVADQDLLIPITNLGADLQKIHHLNDTAAAIWNNLKDEITVEELVTRLSAQYAANPDIIRRDIQQTIDDFIVHGFCLIQN